VVTVGAKQRKMSDVLVQPQKPSEEKKGKMKREALF